jgi:hypothetical protein
MAMTVPEIQRLVEHLRHQARNPRLADPVHLLNLLSQYGEICEEVNVRLRTCGQLLNRGLRSEAIQLAEQVPSVLDTVQLLDCPELPILEELMANQGMVLPPGILFEIATQLNAAYHEERELGPLLRDYRLLALSRAPLKMRLRVLRRIAAKDPASMFWHDDQRLFEQERQLQLQSEISDAGKAGDLALLTEIRTELAAPDWVAQPPAKLLHLLTRNINRCEQANSQQQLQVLIEQLESAQQEGDFALAGSLAETWQHIAPKAELEVNDPLLIRYDHVAAWLAEEHARLSAIDNTRFALHGLEQAINQALTAADLQRQYEHVWQAGVAIPSGLQERVELRVAVLKSREKRRTILRVAGILSLALLLAGGIGWYFQYRAYQSNLTSAVATLEKFLKNKEYEQAESFLQNLRTSLPAITQENSVVQLEKKLAQESQAEQKRLTALNGHWQSLDNSDQEEPDLEILQQAEGLVKTDQEKATLKQWRQRAVAAKEEKQLASDNAFEEKFQALRDEVTRFVAAPVSEEQEAAAEERAALEKKLRKLQETPRVSPHLLQEIAPLESRLAARWQDWEQQRRVDGELQQWLAVASDVERYAQALVDFSKRHPNTMRGKAAADVALETGLWTGGDGWLRLLENSDLYSSAMTSVDAKILLEKAQRQIDQYPNHPFEQEFSKHRSRLEAVVARQKSDAQKLIIDDLRTVFRDPIFTELQMLEMKNGVRYYLTKQLAEKIRFDFWREGRVEKFDCLATFSGVKSNYSADKANVALFGSASHCELCSQLLELLARVDHNNWDASHFAMIRTIEARMKEATVSMDPILNAIILKQVIRQGAQGSTRFRAVFSDKINVLATEDLDLSVNWLNPEDETVTKARVVAKAVLNDYLKTPLAAAPPLPSKPKLHERSGFVYRTTAGDWAWKVAVVPQGKAELSVLWKPEASDAAELVTVAELDNGKLEWRKDISGLRECRPVYLLRK